MASLHNDIADLGSSTLGLSQPPGPPSTPTAVPPREARPGTRRVGRPAKFRRNGGAAAGPSSAGGRSSIPKGKGRRAVFKKSVSRAPAAFATQVTADFVFHKGIYYQVGDIVSVTSLEGDVYYAQIRALLQDQYCEKSAVITWLLPSAGSPPALDGFDPATYTIGPDEEVPRHLACFSLVCSAPADYYRRRRAPYPTAGGPACCAGAGFVISRLRPPAVPAAKARAELSAARPH